MKSAVPIAGCVPLSAFVTGNARARCGPPLPLSHHRSDGIYGGPRQAPMQRDASRTGGQVLHERGVLPRSWLKF